MSTVADQSADDLRSALSQLLVTMDPALAARLEQDPDSYLDLIGLTHRSAEAMRQLLNDAVTSARLAGVSWERIGSRLSMSRQAAQQRFGSVLDTVDLQLSGTKRRLSPVTAFDEMEALAEAGREGWHSIGYGMHFHDLIQSDEQWEHLRVTALGSRRLGLESEGWQRIGTVWFPWAYYARPTGKPIRAVQTTPI